MVMLAREMRFAGLRLFTSLRAACPELVEGFRMTKGHLNYALKEATEGIVMEEENNNIQQFVIQCRSVGPMLHERAARDILRSELQPGIASLNRMIEEGYRITTIDTVVGVDEEGFYLVFELEKG
jgi:hypothetical protein